METVGSKTFSKFPLWIAFSFLCVFDYRFCRFRVNERCIRKGKLPFWPKSFLCKRSLNGVFGPSKEITESTDKCWYIDSVADLVYSVNSTFMSGFTMKDLTAKCEHDITHGIAVTERWIKDYEIYSKKQTRNVVSGAVIVYDSKAKWRAGSARSNDHNYLKPFVLSAMKLQKVEILIIHNILTSNFTQKYEKVCPSCHFVKYFPVNKRIAHNQRFYMIYDYLLKNPDISNFFTADLRDVVF